jgi:pimeloyl-ACP methyl ester carboxylesterase
MKKPHPSGIGAVHSGFLALYGGIKGRLLQQIREGLAKHLPVELILTGHSMGGSLAYLLLLDLLAEELPHSICSKVRVYIATYGAPRTGDRQLVDHFHSVIQQYRSKFGLDDTFLVEYAVQGFNDGKCPQAGPTPTRVNMPFVPEGIPAIPPASWGYRHFCRVPLYSAGGRLYRPPAPNESQVMFFPPEDKMRIFPRGGHNYYNGRDLELLRRRIGWLTSADIKKPGWESRYEAQARRDSS